MTDIFQCTTCDDVDDPEAGPYEEFTFDITKRVKAARAAIALASEAPNDFLGDFGLDSYAEDSARIMSLAYYAGEWPMVGKCPLSGNDGWYLYPSPSNAELLVGTNTWNVHNTVTYADDAKLATRLPREWDGPIRANLDPVDSYSGVGLGGLVGFISGEQREGGDHPPSNVVEYTQSRFAVQVPIGQVFQTATEANIDPGKLMTLITSGVLDDFKAGDYVFLNSPEPHGMMIVGFGPAVGVGGVTDRVEVSDEDSDEQGVEITLTGDEDEIGDLGFYGANRLHVKKVPYVVDWSQQGNDPGILQRPRPFYHTRLVEGVQRFDHTYWLFVPAADAMRIRCDYFLAKNVEGGLNADFFPRTNSMGVYR
jgi:hypothetical protein